VVREPPRKVWDGTQTLEPLKTNVSSTSTSGRTSNSTNAETKLSLLQLERLVNRHAGAFIQDSRSTNGGRLWVVDPGQHVALELELKELGFKWAHMRAAWYILG